MTLRQNPSVMFIYEHDNVEWATISLGHDLLTEAGFLRGLPLLINFRRQFP